jgi:hypothetical protein
MVPVDADWNTLFVRLILHHSHLSPINRIGRGQIQIEHCVPSAHLYFSILNRQANKIGRRLNCKLPLDYAQ